MQRRSTMSGRKVRSSGAPARGLPIRAGVNLGTSARSRPGCPSFVADPAFREIASERTYGRNSTIVRQGDPARYAYVLRRGLVQVASVMPNGKSFVDLMGPGSIFGVPWIMAGLPHGFGLTAVAECELTGWRLPDSSDTSSIMPQRPWSCCGTCAGRKSRLWRTCSTWRRGSHPVNA